MPFEGTPDMIPGEDDALNPENIVVEDLSGTTEDVVLGGGVEEATNETLAEDGIEVQEMEFESPDDLVKEIGGEDLVREMILSQQLDEAKAREMFGDEKYEQIMKG